jgi:hypothetical protein
MDNKINQPIRIKENKTMFLFTNLFLLIGVAILVFTLFYLLFHLDESNKIIIRCIPGFAIGLSSIIIYGFLFVKKGKAKTKSRSHH